MANTSYTLTGDLGDLLGGDLPTQGLAASVITNLRGKALADRSTGGQVRLGDGPLTLDAAGKFTVTLIGTDSTELNVPPGELRYQVVVERGRGRGGWLSGEFELTADADLKDKVGIESPALTSTLAQRAETAATEAEASATEAEAAAASAVGAVSDLDARVTTLEETPAVTSYNDLTDKPTIPATAADVGALPDTTTAADLGAVTFGPGLAEAASPLFIAHRGAGARQYPEYALEGIRAAVAAGLQAVELDTWVLSDGSVGIHHDATLDRATVNTGNVEDQSAVSWQNVKVDGDLVGGAWAGKTYANPLLEDVLREFGNKVILVPEIRAGSAAIIKAALEKYNISREHVLIQAFSLTELTPFIADGYHTLKLGDNPDVPALAAAGVEYVGVPSNSTFDVSTITAAGLKSCVYLVDRHGDREAWEARGVTAFFSDDPIYASGRLPVRLTDPYASQTWYHGDHISSKRGQFTAPDRWGFAADAANGYYGVLQGWASPIDTPEYMGVRFSFTWDSANLDTSYISVFLGTSDVQFKNAAQAGSNGYHFLIRRNGTFVIYRANNGAFTNLGGGSSAAITNGMTTRWRITRTLTGAWSLEREDVAASLTRTDTTYETCPYLFLGVGGVAGHFHDVDTNAI